MAQTSSFILGYDGFNPVLIQCHILSGQVNYNKWVEAIIAKLNMLFVYKERISETKEKTKWKK